MSDVIPRSNYCVAVLVYDGADALDFTGPMQVLSQVSTEHSERTPVFTFKIFAQSQSTRLASSLTIESDILLQNAKNDITDFDVLIVPGAPSTIIQRLVEKDSPEIDLIRHFAASKSTRPRLLLSVCTGAFLLAASGLLSGLTVTTHHREIDTLRNLCAAKSEKGNTTVTTTTTVVRRRFVDGGTLPGTRVQVITSGGITAGIDVAFYIVCKLLNAEVASSASCALEYGWTEPEGGDWPVQFDSRFDS